MDSKQYEGPYDIQHTLRVSQMSDVNTAGQLAQAMALALGFNETASAEVAIATSELASNLVKHARGGTLTLTPLTEEKRVGLHIESQDRGPGIADIEQALTDGFSTAGSLGNGLGAVNRLMDTCEITSQPGTESGTRIVCQRWLRADGHPFVPGPLTFGAATRPHPRMTVNGDAFVIKQWHAGALVGVIDGLGHGPFAHHAAQAARQYVESHFDQPLRAIFQGVDRTCRATRGVVMALARFDRTGTQLSFASIGNVETRVFGSPESLPLIVRRGIVGGNAPTPVSTEHRWVPGNILVLLSDGVTTHWRWKDVAHLATVSATVMAQQLLRRFAKDTDDATVVVVKGRGTPCPSADAVAEGRDNTP
ncbi:MAG TPA: ATP-binding SpoIIE family protein phosphatase [Candidatus Tectomicrobia bacterium]